MLIKKQICINETSFTVSCSYFSRFYCFMITHRCIMATITLKNWDDNIKAGPVRPHKEGRLEKASLSHTRCGALQNFCVAERKHAWTHGICVWTCCSIAQLCSYGEKFVCSRGGGSVDATLLISWTYVKAVTIHAYRIASYSGNRISYRICNKHHIGPEKFHVIIQQPVRNKMS